MSNRIYILIFVVLFSCQSEEVRRPISSKSSVGYVKSIELSRRILQREEKVFREYQKFVGKKFDRSKFGFLYLIENNTSGLIKSGDEVVYTVSIENLNGIVIYGKQQKTLLVDHQNGIKGIHEGLKLMSNGARATFIFPSHQAFGFHGDEKKIKPNTPLVYKVEVSDVRKNVLEEIKDNK